MATRLSCPSRSSRRHPAGADPAKRSQILAGAERVFLEKSFATASVGDICKAAGVSKGTLYVYFADKEDLFSALVAEHRERLFKGIAPLLEGDAPLEERLAAYGRRMAGVICSDLVIRAQRTVIGVIERMPELAVRFYDGGAMRARQILRDFFQREIAAGRLAIDDVALAADQFIELATAGIWRARLFAKRAEPPTEAEIERCVQGAVTMFMKTYAAPPPR